MKPSPSAISGAQPNLLSNLSTAALLSLALLLSACASTSPASKSALAQARIELQTLEADPMAAQAAGKPLQDARDALAAAEQAAKEQKPDIEVQHLAYLASKDAEIGEAVIAEARARSAMAQAQAHRDQVLLEEREHEAQAAQLKAQQAQQQAQMAQVQTQMAQAQTQEAQAQADATRAELEALQAKQTERGLVLSLGSNVLFDTGQNTLKPGADEQLGRLAQLMQSAKRQLKHDQHQDDAGCGKKPLQGNPQSAFEEKQADGHGGGDSHDGPDPGLQTLGG